MDEGVGDMTVGPVTSRTAASALSSASLTGAAKGADTTKAHGSPKAKSTAPATEAQSSESRRTAREHQLAAWPLGYHTPVLLGGALSTVVGGTGLYVSYKTNQGNPPQHEANEGRLEAALTHDTRVAQAQEKLASRSQQLFDKQSELENALLQQGGAGAVVDPALQPWNPAAAAAGAAGQTATDPLQAAAALRVERLNGEVKLLKQQLESEQHVADTAVKLRNQNDAIIHKARYLNSSKVMLYLGGLMTLGLITTAWQAKQGLTLLGLHVKDHFNAAGDN